MKSSLKATLWILTLLTVGYVGQQYRIAQQARASANTQHTSISEVPKPVYTVAKIDGQLMRINEATGETHYWSVDGGGWVKINETNLVSAVGPEEREARKSVIKAWYEAIEPDMKKDIPYETWESAHIDTPSWQTKELFESWKRGQNEIKQKLYEQKWTPVLSTLYNQLTPEEQTAMSYEQYKTKLLAANDLEARQEIIASWYEEMNADYKQRVPFDRFKALEIQESLSSLKSSLTLQQSLETVSASAGSAKLCPRCHNRFSASSEMVTCPVDGEILQVVTTDSQSQISGKAEAFPGVSTNE